MTYQEFIDNIINTRGQWSIPDNKYYEVHHIVPKCLGGLPKRCSHTSKHENLIWLYPKEHFIAHKLLAEEYPDNYKLRYAWKQMWVINSLQERYEPTAEEYEEYLLFSKNKTNYKPSDETKNKISQSNKGKHNRPLTEAEKKHLSEINMGELNPNFGVKRSQETCNKIKLANTGKKASDETKKKLSEAHKGNTSALGHKLSEEAKRKISEASKGRTFSEETKAKLSKNLMGNQYTKGMKWYNNGIISKMFIPGQELDGFVLGRLSKNNKEN